MNVTGFIRTARGLRRALTEQIVWTSLGRGTLVTLPFGLLALATGDELWLSAGLGAISGFIAMERSHLAPAGVLLHGLAMAGGFLVVTLIIGNPPLFVAACAMLAAGVLRLTGEGANLRSLGNFTFIPVLYLACEVSEGVAPDRLAEHALEFLPYLLTAVLATWLLAIADAYGRGDEKRGPALAGRPIFYDPDLGTRERYGEAMVAAGLAVGIAAVLVEWLHLDHGQWVIWSAVSVVTGHIATSRDKLRDRTAGAIIGVPIGVALGLVAPHTLVAYAVASAAAVLTFVAIPWYPAAFTTRCALVAFAIIVANGSPEIAAERVVNVLLGGVIGVLFVLGSHAAGQRFARRGGTGDQS